MEHLLRQHAWIAAERHLFGTPGTDYDFASSDPAKAERRLKEVRLHLFEIDWIQLFLGFFGSEVRRSARPPKFETMRWRGGGRV